MQPAPIDPYDLYMEATYFMEASSIVVIDTNRTLNPHMSMPIMVMRAFALEMYLKCLHAIYLGVVPRGHKLRKLFSSLPVHVQSMLERKFIDHFVPVAAETFLAITGMQKPTFASTVVQCDNAFVNSRYRFEGTEYQGNNGFDDACFAAIDVVNALHPEWQGRFEESKGTELPNPPSIDPAT